MKIALINGSPKMKESASELALKALKPKISGEHEFFEFAFNKTSISGADLEKIETCEVLVFAFPLYVDGIPSHLLRYLYQLEEFYSTKPNKDITVYIIVNCGFFEGSQNAIAIEMMKNWSDKVKLKWGQGVGIGGGGMLTVLEKVPDGKSIKRNFQNAFESLGKNISQSTQADTILTSPNFPRFLYKISAEMGWRQQIKANGLKTKDLFIRK